MIKLRSYRLDDLKELYQLFYDTVHTVNLGDYTKDQVDAWAPKEPIKSLYADLGTNFTRLAIADGCIVGFIELAPDGLVKGLYTHAAYQGRGVGRLLMQAAIDEAKRLKIKELRLESSITARPFYEKMGFVAQEEKMKELRGARFLVIVMTLSCVI